MPIKLICTQDFGDYAKGQEITDPAEVEVVRRDNAIHVVAVSVPDPEPEAAPAEADKAS